MNPPIKQSLLKLQIGPVQDFIAQARSTRDLWSGSYLISWLMAHAIKGLQEWGDHHPSDQVEIIFPMIAAKDDPKRLQQPLVRYLRETKPGGTLPHGLSAKEILSPNLPNLMLAVVPGHWTRTEVEDYVIKPMNIVWQEEQAACLTCYENEFQKGVAEQAFSQHERDLFTQQSNRFWQINWELWPMHDPKTLLDLTKGMPESAAVATHLKQLIQANAFPDDQKLWETHCRFAAHRLDARRQTRNFDAWPVTPLATRDKDALSGREEAIADKAWLVKARKHGYLRYRFRSGDQLGAPNLIKRVWDLAYLKTKHPLLDRTHVTYDSVPGIAAGTWLAELIKRLENSNVEAAFRDFASKAYETNKFISVEIPPTANGRPQTWLERVDAQVFHISTWENWVAQGQGTIDEPLNKSEREMLANTIAALKNLHNVAQIGKPGRYFAVLALDGDKMGAWLTGEKHLKGSRPTKDWHQKFSQALADFSMDHVRDIVEGNHGQLIYAGGDDVLAMLPADAAIKCAQALAGKFRETLAGNNIAPGATASVGIAIAHMKAPLQDVVAAAQDAERTAKREGKDGFGRNAFAVTLFKRSGELVEWGASFKWEKLPPLLALMQKHYRKPVGKPDAIPAISGRFPHVIVERLSAYDLDSKLQPAAATNGTPSLLDIAKAEFDWVVGRQTGVGVSAPDATALRTLRTLRADLIKAGHDFLDELANETASLRSFAGLFSVEAFINQQRD